MGTINYALNKKNIKDVDISNKKVLIRVDLNVPLDGKLKVMDTTKIDAVIPTIQYVLNNKGAAILISHLGRPQGEISERMRLFPIVEKLEARLNMTVKYAETTIGPGAEREIKNLKPGEVLLLENVRFNKEEENNDPEFAKKLASYADIFVNDAFGTVHRSHASTCGICKFIPSVSGLLVEKEIKYFSQIFNSPAKPFVIVLGGAKVSTKIGIIQELLNSVNTIIIGGGMCFTFLKAMGYEIGKSLCELDKLEVAKDIIQKARDNNVEIVLPVDIVVTSELTHNAEKKVVQINGIPHHLMGADIGPETIELFRQKLSTAKTVLWNGPMGVFEVTQFAKGTIEMAKMIAELQSATTLVGGGESVMAVNIAEVKNKITHVSTGGGATLEFLEGKVLPGIDSLMDKNHSLNG